MKWVYSKKNEEANVQSTLYFYKVINMLKDEYIKVGICNNYKFFRVDCRSRIYVRTAKINENFWSRLSDFPWAIENVLCLFFEPTKGID